MLGENRCGGWLWQLVVLVCFLGLVGFSVWVIWFCFASQTPGVMGLLGIPVAIMVLYSMIKNASS